MLRRMLTIGILLVLGVFIMAAGPPTDYDREGSVTGENEERAYVIWWFGPPSTAPGSPDGPLPEGMAEVFSAFPQEMLDQLPSDVREDWDAMVANMMAEAAQQAPMRADSE